MGISKIKFYCDLKELYVIYGLQHFLKKYGFTSTVNPQEADIYLGYSIQESFGTRVQIILNMAAKEGISFLKANGETIPIFKIPVKTEGAEHTIRALHGIEEYPCVSINDKIITMGFDVFSEIGKILAGDYDEHFLGKDRLGAHLRSVPVIDVLEDCIFSAIRKIIPQKCRGPLFSWPGKYKFALVLTHDVDCVYKTYQYVPSILNSIINTKLDELGYHLKNLLLNHGKNDPYWTFDDILKLENSLGVKSTYYFLNERRRINPFSPRSWILYGGVYNIKSAEIRKTIKNLLDTGFEIGVHGSYNSYNDFLALQSEKLTLESISGTKIKGIRQHYLNYSNQITPDIHQKSGFRYDSSVGAKPALGIGFTRGTSFPFYCMLSDSNVSQLMQIPLLIMDGALDVTATVDDCYRLVNEVEKYSGVLTILWHTKSFNPRECPGKLDLYKKIVDEARAREAWITTAEEVCNWLTVN